jgi:AraC-like DNA-binding protein
MVQSGQPSIRPVEFSSRRHEALPVEVIDRSEIVERVAPARLARPERPTFHELILMRSVGGSHTVDFEEIPARPGRLIRIRPGQVQAWNTATHFEATLVLSRPVTPAPDLWFPGDPAYRDLDDEATALADSLIAGIRQQQDSFVGDEPERRLMVSLFDALIALFERAAPDRFESRLPVAYVAFRNALEHDLAWSHDVSDYAERLGYSARTLSRACLLATGQSAKSVLSDRIALEAKRLLVHTDLPAAAIAAELGFSEATNFGKFFVRSVGTSPMAFRRSRR